MGFLDYSCVLLFLAAIILVGGMFAKNEKTTKAFLLGSGKMPWWATSISCIMAIMSTASFVGIPGEAYNHGLRYCIMEFVIPFAAIAFFFLFIRFYFESKAFTPYTYLENRFDSKIRGIISVLFFLVRMSYLAMVLFTCSIVFKGIADWNVSTSILVVGAVAILYCSMGGLKAVIWINVMKFIALWTVIVTIVIICYQKVHGGFTGILSYAFENGHGFNLFVENSDFFSFDPHVRVTFWLLLFNAITQYMFITSADQVTIQQLLSTNSYKKARNSFMGSMFVMLPLIFALWFLGLCIFAYFGQNPAPNVNPPGDLALFRFVKMNLPSPLPGLLVATLMATAISTSGSTLTALSTVVTKDFVLRFIKKDADELTQVKLSRIFVIVIGILGIGVALLINFTSSSLGQTVFEASSIWMAMNTVIAPLFLIGVIFPRCNARHALLAILLGWTATVATIAWYIIGKRAGNPISFMFLHFPGFVTVILVGLASQIFCRENSLEKTTGLTIWTLKKTDCIQFPEKVDSSSL